MLKIVNKLFGFFIISIVCSNSVVASDKLLFTETFDSLERWDILSGVENIILRNPGTYTNYSVDLWRSSYVILKEPLPADRSLKITIKMRMLPESYIQGAGLAINDYYVPMESTGDLKPYQLISNLWLNRFGGPWGYPSAYSLDGISFTNEGLADFTAHYPNIYDWNEFSYIYDDEKYTFIYENKKYETEKTTRQPRYIWIGSPLITNTPQVAGFTQFEVDEISVWQVSNSETFPHYYSQKDPSWGDLQYDSASEWAGADKSSIARWGCALSSAAMVLKKYDIKSPSGDITTPLTLNTWLTSQDDGYIGNGLVNWLAVARYSLLSKNSNHAPHALEYTRESYDPTSISAHLANDVTPIVSTNGHFVLVHNATDTDWIVADPNIDSNAKLAKSTAITRTNIFSPSNTDLSYIMLVADESLSISLDGSTVDIEELSDDIGGDSIKKKIILLPKPSTGKYEIVVAGSGSFSSYLYDKNGDYKLDQWKNDEETTSYEIDFDKDSAIGSSVTELDDDPPAIPTISYPLNNAYLNTKNVKVEWSNSSDISQPVSYHYKLVGSEEINEGIITDTYIELDLVDDNYLLAIEACDSLGNCSNWSESVKFVVDTTIPTLSSTTPDPGWYNEKVKIVLYFTDLNMKDDYTDPICVIKKQGKNLSCQINERICDRAGNCTSSIYTSPKYSIDWTKPLVQAVVWRLSWWTKNKYQPIEVLSIVAQDNLSKNIRVEYKSRLEDDWIVYESPIILGSSKSKMIYYKAIDEAGNTSSIKSISYNYKTATPFLRLW